jgi:multidrug efflux system outer membrane protein
LEQMRIRAFLTPAFLAFLCPAMASAGEKALTLHECINEALGRSPQLEADRYTLAADNEAIKKAKAGILPNLTASADLQNLTGGPVGPFSVLGVNEAEVTGLRGTQRAPIRVSLATVGDGSATIRYPLYSDGSILGLNNAPVVAAAKSVYTRQQWTIRLSEQAVIETLASVFFSTTSYLEKVDIDRQKVELSKKRLEILKQELALDLTLPQYVEAAKAELEADERSLATSEQRALDSGMQLAQLIGHPLNRKLTLDMTEPHIPALPRLESFLDRVASQHPAVGVQQANIDLAQQNLRLAEAQLLPKVDFVTSYTGATSFGRQNPDLLFMALRVEVPIFDWGHGLAAEREERDKVKAAQAELKQVDLNVRETLLSELSDIHTTESTIAGFERTYLDAKNNVNLANERHEQGIAPELELVDAKETLAKAQDDLALARLTLRLEYVRLQRLAGGVWVWNR